MMKRFCLSLTSVITFCCLVFPLCWSSIATAQNVPGATTYQGRLTDSNGAALPDGTGYEIEFRVWSAATGGTLLWGERYASVPLKNGAFNVVLGAAGGTSVNGTQTANFSQAFTAPNRYVGITVVKNAAGASIPSPSEILPRQQLLSSPFAIKAELSGGTVADGITTTMIGNGQVTAPDLGVASVTSEAVKDGEIKTADLANSAVTSDKLANESVRPEKLASEYAVFYEQVTAGTGRPSVAGWQKRSLSTGSETGDSISLASGTITLKAGTYYVEAEAISNVTIRSQLIFRDVTTTSAGVPSTTDAKIIGMTFGATNDHIIMLPNTLKGYVEVSGTRKFELWHWNQVAYVTGLGDGHTVGSGATANPLPDRFAQIHILKVK